MAELNTRLVCAKCGGDRIEVLEWVDANTNEYIGGNDVSIDGDRYCRDCEECTDHCLEEDYVA